MNAPARWEIEERMLRVICRELNLPRERVAPDTRLVEDLGCDCLEFVELLMGIEEEFEVGMPTEPLGQLFTEPATVSTLVDLVIAQWDVPRRSQKPSTRHSEQGESLPFTQFGPEPIERAPKRLYAPLGPNREGYACFQRQTDGMRCVEIPGDRRVLFDAEPVSNASFARFLNSIGLDESSAEPLYGAPESFRAPHRQISRGRRDWRPEPGTESQPVVLVTWFGANAYSLWAHGLDWQAPGSNLPTEAEWNAAAEGVDLATAVAGSHELGNEYGAVLPAHPVNELRGVSKFGLTHMAGNVWHWLHDEYDSERRVERGGSWVGPSSLLETRRGRVPSARGRCLGFRCSASL
jgi:acyl carrier protein